MRDKSFDLGRVLMLVNKVQENGLFQEKYWGRPKDATDWFFSQTKEKQEDVIHEIAYGIQSIDFELSEIWSICMGYDDLNESIRDRNG